MVSNVTEQLLKLFWGKARSTSDNSEKEKLELYPAIYHMIDVALVAEAIIDQLSEQERELVCSPFIDNEDPVAILICLIALHDIGKITPGFQQKLAGRVTLPFDTEAYPINDYSGYESSHSKSGVCILSRYLKSKVPTLGGIAAKKVTVSLASAVASHHGTILWNKSYAGKPIKSHGAENWIDLQIKACDWVSQFFDVDWQKVNIDNSKVTKEWFVYCAGLCSVADWIGSDDEKFDYIDDYYSELTNRKRGAQALVTKLSLKCANLSSYESNKNQPISFDSRFGFKPNALQTFIGAISKQSQPSKLTVIETPMGSGKTEGALYLAESLIRYHGYQGLYIAMPSQATANQLFTRTSNFVDKLPDKTGKIQSHLLHSNAELNDDYQEIRAASVDFGQGRQGGKYNDIVANQWFVGRKKKLLSSFAVGTIDQAVMSGLKLDHFFVRLFSLSGRVLCVDECHAIDSFQLRQLCNLLGWAGLLNIPVILLSATLPESMRLQLCQAYMGDKSLTLASKPYPRVTYVNENNQVKTESLLEQFKQETADKNKSYNIELRPTAQQFIIHNMADDALTMLTKAQGGVITCLVNTVNHAQALTRLVKKKLVEMESSVEVEVITFHARYPIRQRLEIEEKIVELLGPNNSEREKHNPNRPTNNKAVILIGTSVLEQSLNYCSDVFLTELAPMDLILQRLGRLHRHSVNDYVRPELFKQAKAYVYLPEGELTEENQETWLDKGSAFIYAKSILVKTVEVLRNKANEQQQLSVSLPEHIDGFVNDVYEEEIDWQNIGQEANLIAEDWQFLDNYENKTKSSIASGMLFNVNTEWDKLLAYANDGNQSDREETVSTRLAAPSITLVFFKQNAQGFWTTCVDNFVVNLTKGNNQETIKHLKQSAINISHIQWQQHFSAENYQCEYWQQDTKQKQIWQKSSLLFGCVPVCLDANNQYSAEGIGKLTLDQGLGLCW